MIEKLLMFNGLAKYYEFIYSFKDYQKEAYGIIYLVDRFKKSVGNDLLDVASGTGKNLGFLKEKFNCFGVDLNEPMLEVAN